MMMNIRIIKTIEIVTLWSLMIIECRTIRSSYGDDHHMCIICMMITTGSYAAEEGELPWTGNGKRGLFAESIRSTCRRQILSEYLVVCIWLFNLQDWLLHPPTHPPFQRMPLWNLELTVVIRMIVIITLIVIMRVIMEIMTMQWNDLLKSTFTYPCQRDHAASASPAVIGTWSKVAAAMMVILTLYWSIGAQPAANWSE